MIREQLTARNPLRILEKFISGGLRAGGLGLVIAPAGVGKTAFLVQIGLDAIMREKNVLHIALGQNTDHVQAWYDALFDDMAGGRHSDEIEDLRNSSTRYRVLQTYADTAFSPQRLEQTVALFHNHINFKPDVIVIDGFDWACASPVRIAAAIGAFRSCAHRLGAQLWMSAQTHKTFAKAHPTAITPPCDAFEELIDVAIYLEPAGSSVCVRILKSNGYTNIPDPQLLIHCDTLSLAAADAERPLNLPPGPTPCCREARRAPKPCSASAPSSGACRKSTFPSTAMSRRAPGTSSSSPAASLPRAKSAMPISARRCTAAIPARRCSARCSSPSGTR